MEKQKPIGVFDSGVGGLTVLTKLKELMPDEDFIYLGDTARLPYGTKSKETVIEYAHQSASILVDLDIKCLIIACNTASSVAIEDLTKTFHPLPVIGVIDSGAKACAEQANKNVLVLATDSTVKWHAYQKAIAHFSKSLEVIEWPCPLFVALAEEGWTQGPLVEDIVREVLKPLLKQRFDCVMLGCTHFPMLKETISTVMAQTPIIDSATTVARQVKALLEDNHLMNDQGSNHIRFLATDSIERFKQMASRFMGVNLSHDEVVLVHSQNFKQSSAR